MFEITIVTGEHERKFPIVNTPFIFGRHPNPECPDLVLLDPFVSRQHVELNATTDGRLMVRCLGRSSIKLSTGETLKRDCETTVSLPIEVVVGRSCVRVSPIEAASGFSHAATSYSASVEKGQQDFDVSRFASPDAVSPERLIQWFENLVALQATAAGGEGLFQQAAKAVVELIGLDRCVVLSRDGDDWKVNGEHGHRNPTEVVYSHSVVDLVRSSKKTVFECSDEFSATNSLAGISAFVGSPITDASGNIVACLFGVSRPAAMSTATGVLPIEAQLVQVIAGIVSARISRLDAEAEQVRSQVQLEQFASAALVREMHSNPHWLDATERELTLMFGDIRSFTGITQRLTARQTFALVRDVMDCMTSVIHQHGGFVFNFAGDGIAAMWNAPEPISDHAQCACRAALEIQRQLPQTLRSWTPLVGEAIHVGLGINTGNALIGNSGSKERLKYSPLGHSVNLASRIEGATKYFGVATLITQTTRDQLEEPITIRSHGKISVVGIDGGFRVFEIANGSEMDTDLWNAYKQARELYEGGDTDEARYCAKLILEQFPNDRPTKILAEQIESSDDISTPWRLQSK